MFEDLEGWLKNNKNLLPDEDNGGRRKSKSNRSNGMPDPDEIAKALEAALGGNVKAKVLSGGMMISHETKEVDTDKLKDQLDGMANSLMLIGKAAKIVPVCTDAVGNKLKVGDYLKCPGGKDRKCVLEIGYGFCHLSRTDDFKADDGVWHETIIKRFNFLKV